MPLSQKTEYKTSQTSKSKGFKDVFLPLLDRLFGIKKNVLSRIPQTKRNIEAHITAISNFLSSENFKNESAAKLKPYIKKCDDCAALIMSLSEDMHTLHALNHNNDIDTLSNQQLKDYSEKISLYKSLLMLNAVSRYLNQEFEKQFSDICDAESSERYENLIQSASLGLDVSHEELRKAGDEFHFQVGRYFQVVGDHDLAIQEFDKIKIESTEKPIRTVIEQTSSKDEEDDSNSGSIEIGAANETTISPLNSLEKIDSTSEKLKMYKSYSETMLRLNTLSFDSAHPSAEIGKELIEIKSILVKCKKNKYNFPPALKNNIELAIKYINHKINKIEVKLQIERRYNAIESALKALNYKPTLPEERRLEMLEKREAFLKLRQNEFPQEETSIAEKLKKITAEKAKLTETIKQQLNREIELLKRRLKEIHEKLIVLQDQCNNLEHDKREAIKLKIELIDTNLKYLNDDRESPSDTIAPQLKKSVESFLEKKYAIQYCWEDLRKDYDLIVNDLQNYEWSNANMEDINSKQDKLIELKNKFSEIKKTASFCNFFRQHGKYCLNGIELLLKAIIFNKNIFELKGKQIDNTEYSAKLEYFIQLREKIGNEKHTRLTHITLLQPSQATMSEETVSIKTIPQTITILPTPTLTPNDALTQESSGQFESSPKHKLQNNTFWKFFDSLNCFKISKPATILNPKKESSNDVCDTVQTDLIV